MNARMFSIAGWFFRKAERPSTVVKPRCGVSTAYWRAPGTDCRRAGAPVIVHVQSRDDASFLQRRDQRGFVHDRPARCVDEDRAFLHPREIRSADQPTRPRPEHQMDADRVGFGKQPLLAHEFSAAFAGLFGREILTPGGHVHAERVGNIARHVLPDTPKAHEAKSAMFQIDAGRNAFLEMLPCALPASPLAGPCARRRAAAPTSFRRPARASGRPSSWCRRCRVSSRPPCRHWARGSRCRTASSALGRRPIRDAENRERSRSSNTTSKSDNSLTRPHRPVRR